MSIKRFSPPTSWKQKLSIIIGITLLGLSILTGFTYFGMKSVIESFEQQNIANEYKQQSLLLENDLLELESFSASMSIDDVGTVNGKLAGLNTSADNIKKQASLLGNTQLSEYSETISSSIGSYFSTRSDWLELGKELGFSSEEGQLKALYIAMAELEKLTYSVLVDDIGGIAENQRKYVVSKQEENALGIDESLKNLEKTARDLDWSENVIGQTIAKYRVAFDKTHELVLQEQAILAKLTPIKNSLSSLIAEQNQFLNDTIIQQAKQQAQSSSSSAVQVILIVAVIVGAVVFFSLSAIAKQLNTQLKAMQGLLEAVASGNMTKKLELSSNTKDEFTQLRSSSNKMIDDIGNIIGQVINANKSIVNVNQQLKNAMEELGQASEEVEQKTQQSTVASQQISIAVNDVAQRTLGVSETARTASEATQTGGRVVDDCVVSMGSISNLVSNANNEVEKLSQASAKMLGIIDVINGLADQTNLLALNAAIESARAGEAGRGFSVVADEVRALAHKTVDATSSIGDIIGEFNEQSTRMSQLMEEGIRLAASGQDNANNAKVAFESIDVSIQKVAAEMDQVAVAVEEISHNTNDITSQVEHISERTEDTKQTRLELGEHVSHLTTQADTLQQLTGRFTL